MKIKILSMLTILIIFSLFFSTIVIPDSDETRETKSIEVNPVEIIISCPQYMSPRPDWCKDGEIVSGGMDEDGCQLPPRCIQPNLCPELIQGHNNGSENRVNLLFLGFNYSSIDEFKNKSIELVNIDGNGTVSDTGLLSEPPMRDYQNKFNIWYVDTIFPYSYRFDLCYDDHFENQTYYLSDYCPDFSIIQKICLYNISSCTRSGASLSNYSGFIHLCTNPMFGIENLRATLLHEFGHSFGHLFDERNFGSTSDQIPDSPNCDVANETKACSKWCQNPPIPLEGLKNISCDAQTWQECNDLERKNLPCNWVIDECVNSVSFCTSIDDEDTCEYWEYGCSWSENNHSYFKSRCSPSYITYNIGQGCIDETGCYQVCGYSNWFRSSLESRMRSITDHWNYVSEQHLISLIESINASLIIQKSEEKNLLITEEFDNQGNISNIQITEIGKIREVKKPRNFIEIIIKGKSIEIEQKKEQEVVEIKSEKTAITKEKLIIEEDKLYMQTSEGNKQIKILPEEASSKATEITAVKEIELKEEAAKPIYSVKGTKQAKLFFIVPVTLEIETKISAETGEITSISKSWWSFLAW